MDRPIDIIAEALRSHGFDVEDVEPPIIAGKWNGKDAAVFVFVSDEDKDQLFSFLDRDIPSRAVAFLHPLGEGLVSALKREDVRTWDRSMVEALVGRHVLLVKAGMKLTEPLFSPSEKTPEIFFAPLDLKGEQVILPQVSRTEAEHKAARIAGFEFQLLLVPHYLFRYRCSLHNTSGGERPVQGLVWVDAVNGECREMNTHFEATDDLDTAHFRMEPEIELADAVEFALEGIAELNTRETEEVRHTGSATIFEKQRTAPIRESIETELVGILYLPMWNIEGSRGTLTINAVSSEVIRESIYLGKEGS
ncbi:MAG: hypothetical protein KAT70_02925 [Thermoplasmata archaeon]|nr:hypothetical protein [Thermoplasmata archaeon]